MSAVRTPSVFDRPLRPGLAAFFAMSRCKASACAARPEAPVAGVLAELARHGRA